LSHLLSHTKFALSLIVADLSQQCRYPSTSREKLVQQVDKTGDLGTPWSRSAAVYGSERPRIHLADAGHTKLARKPVENDY